MTLAKNACSSCIWPESASTVTKPPPATSLASVDVYKRGAATVVGVLPPPPPPHPTTADAIAKAAVRRMKVFENFITIECLKAEVKRRV